jgi:AcrR family transcriptional regulator
MTVEEIPLGRRERRKLETRRRLLAAAGELIAERGAATLRINDVTERADIGFGTFYTYFETKDALIEAVVSDAVAAIAAAIGTRALEYDDPAESASVSYRRFLRYASDEPAVAGVLVSLEGAEQLFENALLPWARETLRRGIASGRFDIDDLELALTSVAASALAAIRGILAGRVDPGAGVSGAVMMLRGFGLDDAEAREIAQRPLPRIELTTRTDPSGAPR